MKKILILGLIINLTLASLLFGQETGERILIKHDNKVSLDLKGMDIIDVLKMLAVKNKMNLVIGKNVSGRITLFLRDVDLWDAFDIIIASGDLAYDKKGDIINVMTARDYEAIYGEGFQDKKQIYTKRLEHSNALDLSRTLNQIKSNIGRIVVDEVSNTVTVLDIPQKIEQMQVMIKEMDMPRQTKIFSLNYATAEKISAKIQEVLTKGIATIKIDERTNKIAVIDYPYKIKEIENIINEFDEKTKEVIIDAKIIEITLSDEFKMGIDWESWLRKNLDFKSSFAPGVSPQTQWIIGATNIDRTGKYKAIVEALRTIGNTKILSSPRIAAVNNQEAKILVGTKEVYVTQTTSLGSSGTAVTADAANFVDVGIKLYVTPVINADGYVTIRVRPEVSSVPSFYEYGTPTKKIPIVSTSEAETTVMVKDGTTIIMAGLMKDKKEKTINKIPLLGDIPLLGHVFRKTNDKVTKTELVVLLTPRLFSGDELLEYKSLTNVKEVIEPIKEAKLKEAIVEKENTQHFVVWHDYCNSIRNKILEQARLVKAFPDKNTEAMVSFVLESDGSLKEEPFVVSEVNDNFKKLAINSIKNASPFPAFPQSLDKKEESFNIVISYKGK